MQIVCPHCATGYEVAANAIPTAGRSVRCVRCREVWFVAAAMADAVMADAAMADAVMADADVGTAGAPMREFTPEPASADFDPAGSTEVMVIDGAAPSLAPNSPVRTGAAGGSALIEIDAPALAPAAPTIELSGDIESAAVRTTAPVRVTRPKARRTGDLAVLIGVMTLVVAALLIWRTEVVRAAPQMAGLYRLAGLPVNLRSLAFRDVATHLESRDGTTVLVVEGTLASLAGQRAEVPRLRFSVRNAAGQEIYTWTAQPPRPALDPQETVPFRSMLASPPGDGRAVLVRFFNRRDLAAGIQ